MITEWNCEALDATNTHCYSTASTFSNVVATTTDSYLGSLAFGSAVVVVLLSLISVGFIYNNMSNKKPWR